MSYQLSCESTIDLPYEYKKQRNISIINYTYTIEELEYVDDMGKYEDSLPQFYKHLEEGKLPTTSQINTFRYIRHFEKLLQKGDVLHLVLSSGITNSYAGAKAAQETLQEKYPDRKIIVIDSLCASSGFGLLLDTVADMRDNGATIDELAAWIEENKLNVQHQIITTDLTMFKRSGRVSGPTATIGTLLGICPIMKLNNKGKIISYDKARGKKNAIKDTVNEMVKLACNNVNYNGKCFISHSNCIDLALELKTKVEQTFPYVQDIQIHNIGTVIASHTGKGTVALFFMGEKRVD